MPKTARGKKEEKVEEVGEESSVAKKEGRKSLRLTETPSASRKRKVVGNHEEDAKADGEANRTPKRRKVQTDGSNSTPMTPKTPKTPRKGKKAALEPEPTTSSEVAEDAPMLTEEEMAKLKEKLQKEEEERLLEEQERARVSQPVWSDFLASLRKAETSPEFWKRIFFLGTEVHLYPSILEREFDFSHLKRDLQSEKFRENDNLYIFGATEGHAFDLIVDLVPVIIVVASRLPPPEKVALTSLQQSKEEVGSFRSWHLTWAPLFVDEDENAKVSSLKKKTHFYSLAFTQPRSVLKPSDSKVRGYQFLLPHILFPRLLDEFEPDVEINFSMVIENKVCAMEMNVEMDTVDDRAKELCEEHEVSEEKWAEEIKQKLIEEKKLLRQKNADKKKALEAELNKYSKAEIESFKSLKVYKYYPLSMPQEIRSHFVNRTYGQSEAVFPPCCNPLCSKCAALNGSEGENKKNAEDKKEEGETWQCIVCTTPNPSANAACAACLVPRS